MGSSSSESAESVEARKRQLELEQERLKLQKEQMAMAKKQKHEQDVRNAKERGEQTIATHLQEVQTKATESEKEIQEKQAGVNKDEALNQIKRKLRKKSSANFGNSFMK